MNTKPTPKPQPTKTTKSQDNQQTFLQRILVLLFVMQLALIGIRGNLDIHSGKPIIDVLQGMISQSIELIIKAQTTQKSTKKGDTDNK
ncbi:MAG: hypothetical protein WA828_17800 [Coleofasciculaceae cyanobacterium]